MFLVNSRLGLDSAASSGSRSQFCHPTEAPLLPKLRGYFAEFLSQSSPDRLGILYLPTCVGFGTGTHLSSLEVFLGGRGSAACRQMPADITSQAYMASGFSWRPPYALVRGLPTPRSAYLSASPHCSNARWWHWNINQFSIAYAFRPRLRPRLTLS